MERLVLLEHVEVLEWTLPTVIACEFLELLAPVVARNLQEHQVLELLV